MPTVEELGQRTKAKYPGTYDDLPDADVGKRVKAKYPGAYDDFTDTPAPVKATQPKRNDGFFPTVIDPRGLQPKQASELQKTAGMPEDSREFMQGVTELLSGEGEGRAMGASRILRSLGKMGSMAFAPALAGAAAGAPLVAAGGMVGGMAGQAVVEGGARAMGASEGVSRLAGDTVGAIGGGVAGAKLAPAVAKAAPALVEEAAVRAVSKAIGVPTEVVRGVRGAVGDTFREVAGRRAAGPAPIETPPVAPPPVAPPPVAAAPVAAKPAPKPAKVAAPPTPPAPPPIVEPPPPPEPPYVPTHDPLAGLDPKIAAAKQAFRSAKDKLTTAAAEVTAKQTSAAEKLKPKPADPDLSARVQTLVEKAREIATPDEMAAAKGAAPLETVPAKFKGEPKPEPSNAELESLLQQSLDMVKAKKAGANAPKSGVEPIAGGTAAAGAAEPVPAPKPEPVAPAAVEAAKPAPAAVKSVKAKRIDAENSNYAWDQSGWSFGEPAPGVVRDLKIKAQGRYYQVANKADSTNGVIRNGNRFEYKEDGFTLGQLKLDAKGRIQDVAVAPPFQGKGIGTKLMQAAKDAGVKVDDLKGTVSVSDAGAGLLRKFGVDAVEAKPAAAPLSDIDKLRARFAEVDAKPPKNPAHAEEAVNAPGLDIGPVKKLKAAAKRAKKP